MLAGEGPRAGAPRLMPSRRVPTQQQARAAMELGPVRVEWGYPAAGESDPADRWLKENGQGAGEGR